MRRILVVVSLVCLGLGQSVAAIAQAGADEVAIRAEITAQVEAWNHADIPAFMRGYENSTETTFIGASIGKGYAKILERYQKSYTNSEQMGKLTFNDLDIRILPSHCGK